MKYNANDAIHRTPTRWHVGCLVVTLPASVAPAVWCRSSWAFGKNMSKARIAGISLLTVYVFSCFFFAHMQANNLAFKEAIYRDIAIGLCGFSLIGLLVWDRTCGLLVPEVTFIVRIVIVVSVIGFLFSLSIPTIQ